MSDKANPISTYNWRYATKSFDSHKTICCEALATLEEALRLTPSSFGLQPWHFFVISNPDLRANLRQHSWNQAQVTDCSHFVVLCTRTDIDTAYIDRFIALTAAKRGTQPSDLQVYRDMMVGFVTRMPATESLTWASRQTYLALQRLLDTAALLEIDACPMEGFSAPEYDEILSLSEKNLTATVCCALGYRSSEDKYATAAKVRFPIDEIITHLK